MITIEYKELQEKYEKILTSTSRGFDTNHDFLESWVPSSEITQSILDLINSALDYKINNLEIIFDVKNFDQINFDKIDKKFPKLINIIPEDYKIIIFKINEKKFLRMKNLFFHFSMTKKRVNLKMLILKIKPKFTRKKYFKRSCKSFYECSIQDYMSI